MRLISWQTVELVLAYKSDFFVFSVFFMINKFDDATEDNSGELSCSLTKDLTGDELMEIEFICLTLMELMRNMLKNLLISSSLIILISVEKGCSPKIVVILADQHYFDSVHSYMRVGNIYICVK